MSGIVKFMTGWLDSGIRRVEVVRETEASVWVVRNGLARSQKTERREAKRGEYAQYHDTWEAAHAHLVKKAESEVKAARLQLEKVNGKLGNIKGMPVGKVSK
jgi:hypothetical protein